MIEALGITCVKNEADVIEAFVRHNLNFMDALVILDNDSVDGTREILVQLRQEGIPIIIFDDPVVAHFQAEKVTAVYRRVVPMFKPRFVFLLDADEFIVARSREALYAQLRSIRPGRQARYFWRTYIPAPTGANPDASDPLRSITHRRVAEESWPKSIVITKPKIDAKIKVEQGNHNVKYAGLPLPAVKLKDVALAHFPIRSIDQATGKALVGWITNLERNRHDRSRGFGFQKKLLYERIVDGGGLTTEDVTREALKYGQRANSKYANLKWPQDVVRDPIVPGYAKLTVRPSTTITTLQKVMTCVDRVLNPDANPPGRASAANFLRIPQKASGHWIGVSTPRAAVTKFKAAVAHHRRSKDVYADLPPFGYLADRDRPASVLDIGCGSGAYVEYFNSQGAQWVNGVNSTDAGHGFLDPDKYLRLDLRKPFDLSKTYELVICMGIIENFSH